MVRSSNGLVMRELEHARRRIPFVKYGGLRHLEAAHVKDFVALLRLADNGADDVAWFRVLQLAEGIGPASARRATAAMSGDAAGGTAGARGAAGTAGAAGAGDEVAGGRLAISPDRLAAWPVAREVIPSGARASADSLIAALAAAREEQRAGPRAEALREA